MIPSRNVSVVLLVLGVAFLLVSTLAGVVGWQGQVHHYLLAVTCLSFGAGGVWSLARGIPGQRRRSAGSGGLASGSHWFELGLVALLVAGLLGILGGLVWSPRILAYGGLFCILACVGGLPLTFTASDAPRATGEDGCRMEPGVPKDVVSRVAAARIAAAVLDLAVVLACGSLLWTVSLHVVDLFGRVALSHQPGWSFSLLGDLGAGQRQVMAASLVPLTVIVGFRAQQRFGARAAVLLTHGLLGAVALALSYRLTGMVVLLVVLGAEALLHMPPVRLRTLWLAWALALALCLLPVDISLRRFPGRGARLVPAVAGCPGPDAFRKDAAGDIVIVGGDDPGYLEPTWIVVW